MLILLVSVSLSALPSAEQMKELRELRNEALVRRALQGWQAMLSSEAFEASQLARVRRHIAVQDLNIDLHERLEAMGLLHATQQEVEKWRSVREKAKKYEEVLLWAQKQRRRNPGRETERIIIERIGQAQEEVLGPRLPIAPPPRAVKP